MLSLQISDEAFIEYICNNDVTDIGETLKQFIYQDMAKKKKKDLKVVIAEALEHYHKYVKKTIKDSTIRQNESLLSEFGRFIDTLPEKDKTMHIFSQKGLNMYVLPDHRCQSISRIIHFAAHSGKYLYLTRRR